MQFQLSISCWAVRNQQSERLCQSAQSRALHACAQQTDIIQAKVQWILNKLNKKNGCFYEKKKWKKVKNKQKCCNKERYSAKSATMNPKLFQQQKQTVVTATE